MSFGGRRDRSHRLELEEENLSVTVSWWKLSRLLRCYLAPWPNAAKASRICRISCSSLDWFALVSAFAPLSSKTPVATVHGFSLRIFEKTLQKIYIVGRFDIYLHLVFSLLYRVSTFASLLLHFHWGCRIDKNYCCLLIIVNRRTNSGISNFGWILP